MSQLREAAKDAKELLAEIVTRKMLNKLPRENFWRECGAVRERLQAALDGDTYSNRLRESINEQLDRLDEVE